MKIDKRRAVAFTGHRTFKTSEAPADLFATPPDALPGRLHETLAELAACGYTEFLCGMAEGFDLMAAQAVCTLRGEFPHTRLIAVVPFPGQADNFPADLRERYDTLLAQAANVVMVSSGYSAECFHRRNDYLIDHASVLVCYYNGTRGGTAYTVKRALKQGLRIINLL